MIRFLDLQKVNALYAADMKAAAGEIIDNGWFLHGKYNEKFSKDLQDFIGTKHIVPCGNGLDALRMIFRAFKEMGVMKDGDEVIVPANTYIATVLAITDNRLTPVFVDPSEDSFNIDIDKIEAAITPKTKAIAVVHLYGQACWSDKLNDLKKKYNLKIVEDNAQAIGAKWHGIRTGNLGDAAGFSFYPGKNLGALGDSGAVATNDDKLADIVEALGNYGSHIRYVHEYAGLNSRMDELQAAFLDIKLQHIDEHNAIRRANAKKYLEGIKNPLIRLPKLVNESEEGHVFHLFVIRCERRDELRQFLADNGIESLIHYPTPVPKQKCYKQYAEAKCPVADKVQSEILSIPMSSVLTDEEINQVINTLNSFK